MANTGWPPEKFGSRGITRVQQRVGVWPAHSLLLARPHRPEARSAAPPRLVIAPSPGCNQALPETPLTKSALPSPVTAPVVSLGGRRQSETRTRSSRSKRGRLQWPIATPAKATPPSRATC
ncbi:hypothetical protein BFW01_g11309 [Lasiodiplodia theobromae]|nr:hypothetical protein BFW01_g11309 [Lasiodiplodia theobromae]